MIDRGPMIEITETRIVGGVLTIACAGEYGIGSQGNPSARLIKDVLLEELGRHRREISRVVIDLRQVVYEWGDAIGTPFFIALGAGLPVTCLTSVENHTALHTLFYSSGLLKSGGIDIRKDGR